MTTSPPAAAGRPLPERTRRSVGRAAVDVATALVALLITLAIAAHTAMSARATHHLPTPDGGGTLERQDWHDGLLLLAAVPMLGAVLAAVGLVTGLRSLHRGHRAGAAARALPIAAIVLAIVVLVFATWARAQLGSR